MGPLCAGSRLSSAFALAFFVGLDLVRPAVADIVPGYGMQQFTCARRMPDGTDVYSLIFDVIINNNLGGQGPIYQGGNTIIYDRALRMRGRWINVKVEVIGRYRTRTATRNGKNGNVGRITVEKNFRTHLRFTFVDRRTGAVVIIPWLQWALYNYNTAGVTRKCTTVSGFASYGLVPGSLVQVNALDRNSAEFCTDGTGVPDVTDVNTISTAQAQVAVLFLFQYVYQIDMWIEYDTEFSGYIDPMCRMMPQKPYKILTSPDGVTSVGWPSQLTASCVFDNLQAMTYLSQAGTAIDAAVRACDKNGPQPPTHAFPGSTRCWIDVTNILESFGYAASFLSSAVNQCDLRSQNVNAQCASDISGLVAAIADLHQAGGGMSQDCPDGAAYAGKPQPEISPVPLQKSPPAPQGLPVAPLDQTPLQRTWGSNMAFCAIDSMQATWYLAKAGLNIDAAVAACPHSNPAYCSTSVSAAFTSFTYVATYISQAAAQCMHGLNRKAACASDVARLVSGLGSVAARASSMSRYCTGAAAKDAKWNGEPLVWHDRRLQFV